MIKLFICKNKEIEITFRNCLIFRDDKLSTILLKKNLSIIKFYKVNYTLYHVSK